MSNLKNNSAKTNSELGDKFNQISNGISNGFDLLDEFKNAKTGGQKIKTIAKMIMATSG